MARQHDGQRAKFWAADSILDDHARSLGTETTVKRFIKDACGRAFLTRRYRAELLREIILRFDTNPRRRHYETSYWSIIVPPHVSAWTDHNLCRQLAYIIHARRDRLGKLAWHGREFCAIYLDVVRALMGVAAHDLLRARFRYTGVRFTPKRTRTLTPEQREAARSRMARIKETA